MMIPTRSGPYDLTEDLIAALQHRYPLADVNRELLLALLWLAKHPSRLPVRPLRFLENWLAKASPRAPMVEIGKWWQSEQQTLAMAGKLGMTPRPGEEWPALRERVRLRLLEGSPRPPGGLVGDSGRKKA